MSSEVHLNLLSTSLRKEWEHLVAVAMDVETPDIGQAAAAIAFTSKVGKDSIERKLRAIQHAISNGMSKAILLEMGQEAIVSSYNRARKVEQQEQQVYIKYKVSGSLRDAMEDERARISKILHFTNTEQFITWLHSVLAGSSDEEVKHSAGDLEPKRS